jgi:hypothetical protein
MKYNRVDIKLQPVGRGSTVKVDGEVLVTLAEAGMSSMTLEETLTPNRPAQVVVVMDGRLGYLVRFADKDGVLGFDVGGALYWVHHSRLEKRGDVWFEVPR